MNEGSKQSSNASFIKVLLEMGKDLHPQHIVSQGLELSSQLPHVSWLLIAPASEQLSLSAESLEILQQQPSVRLLEMTMFCAGAAATPYCTGSHTTAFNQLTLDYQYHS